MAAMPKLLVGFPVILFMISFASSQSLSGNTDGSCDIAGDCGSPRKHCCVIPVRGKRELSPGSGICEDRPGLDAICLVNGNGNYNESIFGAVIHCPCPNNMFCEEDPALGQLVPQGPQGRCHPVKNEDGSCDSARDCGRPRKHCCVIPVRGKRQLSAGSGICEERPGLDDICLVNGNGNYNESIFGAVIHCPCPNNMFCEEDPALGQEFPQGPQGRCRLVTSEDSSCDNARDCGSPRKHCCVIPVRGKRQLSAGSGICEDRPGFGDICLVNGNGNYNESIFGAVIHCPCPKKMFCEEDPSLGQLVPQGPQGRCRLVQNEDSSCDNARHCGRPRKHCCVIPVRGKRQLSVGSGICEDRPGFGDICLVNGNGNYNESIFGAVIHCPCPNNMFCEEDPSLGQLVPQGPQGRCRLVQNEDGSCDNARDCGRPRKHCCVIPVRGKRQLSAGSGVCEDRPGFGGICLVNGNGNYNESIFGAVIHCPCPNNMFCEEDPSLGQLVPQGPQGRCALPSRRKAP